MNAKAFNVTTTRNVGLNRGTPRVWLEGNKLDMSGFAANVLYSKKINRETIVLTLDDAGEFKVSSKKATGKNPAPGYRVPVIDLHNAGMAEWLNGAEQVNVNYQEGVITIKRIKP